MMLLQTGGSGSVHGCCLTSIRMLSVISLDLLFQWDCLTAGGVKAMTLISSLRGAVRRPGITKSGSADVRKPKGIFFLPPFLSWQMGNTNLFQHNRICICTPPVFIKSKQHISGLKGPPPHRHIIHGTGPLGGLLVPPTLKISEHWVQYHFVQTVKFLSYATVDMLFARQPLMSPSGTGTVFWIDSPKGSGPVTWSIRM